MTTRNESIREFNSVVRRHKLRWKRRRELPPLAPRVPIGEKVARSEIGTQDPGD